MTLATDDEAMREFAENIGYEFAEREWLLTSYYVWVCNPHYCGPEGRHPEDDADFCGDIGHNVATANDFDTIKDEDIPF